MQHSAFLRPRNVLKLGTTQCSASPLHCLQHTSHRRRPRRSCVRPEPPYSWTEPELVQFIGWCEQRGVQHLDLWRGDLNTLNPVDGTAEWYYGLLAKFLMKQKGDGSPSHGGGLATGDSH